MNGDAGNWRRWEADVPPSGPEAAGMRRGGCLQRAVAAIKAEDPGQAASGWEYAEAQPPIDRRRAY